MNRRAAVIAAACVLALGAPRAGVRSRPQRGPLVGAGAPVHETRDELLVATGDAVWRGDLTRRTSR